MLNSIRNLRAGVKLTLGFSTVVLLFIVAAGVALERMSVMNSKSDLVVNRASKQYQAAAKLTYDVNRYLIWQMCWVSTPKNIVPMAHQGLIDCASAFYSDLSAYEAVSPSAENWRMAGLLSDAFGAMGSHTNAILQAYGRNDLQGMRTNINKAGLAFVPASNILKEMAQSAENESAVYGAESATAYTQARVTLLVSIAVVVLFSAGIALTLTSYISRSLDSVAGRLGEIDAHDLPNLEAGLKALASGDLTATVESSLERLKVTSKDEFGNLGSSVNSILDKIGETVVFFHKSQESLSRMVSDVLETGKSIAGSAAQLTEGHEDLARRTVEQASSIEETAASMELMTSIARANAKGAVNAKELADETRGVAQAGGEVVGEAVRAMGEINVCSKRISDIVSVIDEIAFQTNLLALNAAVEAARVGDQGRGFAVVASEVRSLAGRSSAAAKEIKHLVSDSEAKVLEGTHLVTKSGDRLKEIMASVNRLATLVADISNGSQEQSAGIEQVNKAVVNLDEITQMNSALVEEATASSNELSRSAETLKTNVQRFRLPSRFRTPSGVSGGPRRKAA